VSRNDRHRAPAEITAGARSDSAGYSYQPELATWLPIVLFIDSGFELAPFAEAFAGELAFRDEVTESEREHVVALVTGIKPVGAHEVAPYPGLKLVLTCSTGTDHVDTAELTRRGLTVCNTPTYCSDEVADHALACVLAGWRQLWTLGDDVRAGGWDASASLRRFDAQRLGIVGLGRIGSRLARSALALGIEVVGSDPYAPPPDGVRLLELDELLATSDAVSLHLPGRPGAPPLLDARRIASLKPRAVLVNLARASLVDLDALLAALDSGAIGAAAWDVWPQEPPAAGDPRLRARGLLVTPHVGWSSPQADEAYQREAIAALRDTLIRGQEPAGLVR
jgi:D-3-phosphoglycerate dehydrogenase / 2-oxoglutarate reductase